MVLRIQYTWHSTTTTFPPNDPPFEDLSAYSYGYGGHIARTTSTGGGEVRTTIIRTAGGTAGQYAYEHLLGWYNDYDWNNGYDRFTGYIIKFYEYGYYYPMTAYIYRYTWLNGSIQQTLLTTIPMFSMPNGTILSSSIRPSDGPNGQGAGIHIRAGSQAYYYRATNLVVGSRNGIGRPVGWSEMYSDARVGALDQVAPGAVTGLTTSVANGWLTASWNAATDNANGIGSVRYEVFNGSTSLGTTSSTNWMIAVQPGQSFTLTVKAYDGHRNFNTGTSLYVTVPSPTTGGGLVDDSVRTGVHAQSAQWGAMGESIDLRSMNLNYTIPLLKAQGRSGLGLGIHLSYNSQNWRKENSTVTQIGADVGYGFGWRLQAGSLFPVFTSPTTLSYFLYTDTTGAQYRLDQQNGNVWTTKQGAFVWFDASSYQLQLADGTKWSFGSVSGASEQDAGTRYPTMVQDRHGNRILLTYGPAVGGSIQNSSARLLKIDDVRSTLASNWITYGFTYNADAIPHLTGITNNINTGEAYTLAFSAAQALYEPFTGSQQFGTAVRLNSLTQNGVGLTTAFQYNSSGEMTKITFPLGGEMMWNYTNQSYANGRQAREVLSRDLRKTAGASTVNYAFSHPGGDSSLKYHSETTLADPSNVGQRRWSFFTTTDFKQGLTSKYEELDGWVVKSRSENTWTVSGTASPQISEVLNTIDVGQSFQKQMKRIQTIDAYGNLATSSVYGYADLTTIVRTDTRSHIYREPYSWSATQGGVSINGGTVTFDGSTLASVPGDIRLWVNPNTTARLLPTSRNDGYTTQTATYNLAGQPVTGGDGQGLSQAITYGGVGGSMVPTQITPNGNTALGSSMNWNGFLGLTSVSAGNGGSQAFGYDAYARPQTQTSPDGATSTFSYIPGDRISQTYINGRVHRTTHDGLGRPVRVEVTAGGVTASIVDTEYEPCACSPMGKVKRVSLPYLPGGTVYWTVYTYDGLGRTLSVAQPNGAGTTTYLYEGNTVKVTSPSGKWKKYEMNVLGQMVQVTEPRPGGGTYLTNYTYNVAGKLVGVSMPRDSVTQTRTFTYDTTSQSRLLTAANPENGTVTYTYNLDGTTATKTDAKGIKTEISYDAYKRVSLMKKLTLVSSVWTEDRCQRVSYIYDEGVTANRGRLTRVRWNWMLNGQSVEVPCAVGGGFEESYNYNAAGRVVEKKLALTKTSGSLSGTGMLVAGWTYNNEGHVTSVSYPAHFEGTMTSSRVVNHGFDAFARLTSVDTKLSTVADPSPSWQSVISNAQFNAFGGLTTLNHLGLTETRQYNTLGQMTRMTKGSLIDIEYRFSATANDGKIMSQKNWLTGEDVVYAYDELERLISATAGASWGLSWSYDGFGNRLSQNVTLGTAPSNVVLVDANTNRISSSGFTYDLNGNMTLMPKGSGSMTMNYDLSNRMTSVSHPDGSEQYAYAPDNRRAWRSYGRGSCRATRGNDQELYWSGYFQGEGVFEQVILYSPGGQKMGVYCMEFSPNMQYYAVSASEENVFYGGRLVAKRALGLNPSLGTVSDFTADRLQSKGDGSRFYPYGESKTSAAGDDREQFATYTRDEKSGLDYADQRWYASGVGRFTSPDPLEASASISSPLSFNRFGYVNSSPISHNDPRGLSMQLVGTSTCVVGVGENAQEVLCEVYHIRYDLPVLQIQNEPAPLLDLPVLVDSGITFVGHTTNTSYDQEIKDRLAALITQLDSDCEKWLQEGLQAVSPGQGLRDFVSYLKPGVGSALRIYDDSDPGRIINATQGAGLNGNITINATGAYYYNNINLGAGTNGINSGSGRAKTLLLIHELAHIVGAAGFLPDRNSHAAGESNNKMIRTNCDKTLSSFSNQ